MSSWCKRKPGVKFKESIAMLKHSSAMLQYFIARLIGVNPALKESIAILQYSIARFKDTIARLKGINAAVKESIAIL